MSGYPGEGGPTVEPGEWLDARDLSRLDAMISWLEANPLVHDQETWGYLDPTAPTVTIPGNGEICGTACCLAGWTLLFDHEHYHFDAEVNRIVDKRNATRWLDSDDFIIRAGDRLGLTDLEASVLFSACHTLRDLRQMTTDLQAGVDITDSGYDPIAVTA